MLFSLPHRRLFLVDFAVKDFGCWNEGCVENFILHLEEDVDVGFVGSGIGWGPHIV